MPIFFSPSRILEPFPILSPSRAKLISVMRFFFVLQVTKLVELSFVLIMRGTSIETWSYGCFVKDAKGWSSWLQFHFALTYSQALSCNGVEQYTCKDEHQRKMSFKLGEWQQTNKFSYRHNKHEPGRTRTWSRKLFHFYKTQNLFPLKFIACQHSLGKHEPG